MSELYKCGRCGRILISEEYDSHKCKISINGKISVVEVDSWIEGRHPRTGEHLISAKAMDGTTYWLVKRECKPSDRQPFTPTNLNNQNKHPENEQQLKLSSVQSLRCFGGVFNLVGKT